LNQPVIDQSAAQQVTFVRPDGSSFIVTSVAIGQVAATTPKGFVPAGQYLICTVNAGMFRNFGVWRMFGPNSLAGAYFYVSVS
jgi:hypothetical protein